jgi:hypothetical protein
MSKSKRARSIKPRSASKNRSKATSRSATPSGRGAERSRRALLRSRHRWLCAPPTIETSSTKRSGGLRGRGRADRANRQSAGNVEQLRDAGAHLNFPGDFLRGAGQTQLPRSSYSPLVAVIMNGKMWPSSSYLLGAARLRKREPYNQTPHGLVIRIAELARLTLRSR